MIVYIQQIRVAGWLRVVLSWLLLYMGASIVTSLSLNILMKRLETFGQVSLISQNKTASLHEIPSLPLLRFHFTR